jgi:hypothetical protein
MSDSHGRVGVMKDVSKALDTHRKAVDALLEAAKPLLALHQMIDTLPPVCRFELEKKLLEAAGNAIEANLELKEEIANGSRWGTSVCSTRQQ